MSTVRERVPSDVRERAAERRADRVPGAPGRVQEPEGEALREPHALGAVGEQGHGRRPEGAERDRRRDEERDDDAGPAGERRAPR